MLPRRVGLWEQTLAEDMTSPGFGVFYESFGATMPRELDMGYGKVCVCVCVC